jgi:O-antigen/teichoic acid export membrane protein
MLGVPALVTYLWLLPVGILLGAGYTVFNAWSVRTKAYSAIASTRFRQALATMLIQVAAYPLGAMALLIAAIAGQSIGTMRLARKALSGSQFRSVNKPGIKRVAQRYRRFPIYSSWDGLLNTAGREFPPLVFAAVFGSGATGFYALAHHVLSKPMALIGGAVGQVFFANGAEAHRQGKLGELVTNLHEKLAHIAMPPLVLLAMRGPELFSLVFGENWKQAGVYAQWMSPWMYLMCVSSPLSTVLTVLEKQKHTLLFQIMLTAFRVAAVVFGIKMGDMLTTVISFSLASVLAYLILLVMIFKLAGSQLKSCFSATLMAMLVSGICIMPLGVSLLSDGLRLEMGFYPLALAIALLAIRYVYMVKQAY